MTVDAILPVAITERDWALVEQRYQESSPYNYSVLDDFFAADVFRSVRDQLLANWGWQYKNWQANELYVRDPKIPEIEVVATSSRSAFPRCSTVWILYVAGHSCTSEMWALRCTRTTAQSP